MVDHFLGFRERNERFLRTKCDVVYDWNQQQHLQHTRLWGSSNGAAG
jgi:hypothetical protein